MERSEPTLVPEWLRCSGGITGGASSGNQFVSSSHSDALSLRNRSLRSISDKDNPRATFLDRSNSSNSRRSSGSNSSTKHPYSSFTRSHRDKNHRDKEKETSVGRDLWDHECSDPLENIFFSRVEKNTFRRSQSMVTRKPCQPLFRREVELKNGGVFNHNGNNGMLSSYRLANGIGKTVFEKDFPTLGNEEKQGVPTMGRVSSPGLSTSVQSLPIGLAREGWTSALAEVPAIVSSSGMGPAAVPQSTVAAPTSMGSSTMVGLNMAEALSQTPLHARTTPQLPDKTQRLEELAIKQSRQLIPMTPPTPKPLVLNSSDRLKHPKTAAARTSEIIVAKSQQQQLVSSQLTSQSPRVGQVRSDVPKTSNGGKFLVLKPVWENGVSSSKDVPCFNNSSDKLENSQQQPATPLSPTPLTSPNHPKFSVVERKAAALVLNHISNVEKRSSLSQSQSRSDFFNLMRKKTSVNASAILSDSSPGGLSPIIENSSQLMHEDISAPLGPCITNNASHMTTNGDTNEDDHRFSSDGEKNICLNGAVYTDEEEAAFLRSLGWEENAGEDEGLTEEEINAFYQEYMKLRPSPKVCRGAQPKFSFLTESCEPNLGELL